MKGFIQQMYFFPWVGYFKKIENSEIFIIQDHVQFRRKYISYTFIQNNGVKSKLNLKIGKSISKKCNEIEFLFSKERFDYIMITLRSNYGKTPYFKEVFPFVFKLLSKYQNKTLNIVQFNYEIFLELRKLLQLKEIKIEFSSNLPHDFENKSLDMIKKLETLKIDNLIVGSLDTFQLLYDEKLFDKHNIIRTEIPYHLQQIPYKQKSKEFIEGLSILDVLFNEGIKKTKKIIEQ